jgi:hypothetical protein
MSDHKTSGQRNWIAVPITWFPIAALVAGLCAEASAGGPSDLPESPEPRVEAGKCLSPRGMLSSKGNARPFARVAKDATVFTRDLLVAVPGFQIVLEPASKNVSLTLWGNLPELSRSPVLESAVVLHDTKAFDLDFTLVRGRIVLTNVRAKGAAKVWLRAKTGVQLTLPEPGDSVALDMYGRYPSGQSFSRNPKAGDGPIQLWEAHCLKGTLDIKAGDTEWAMTAAPGLAYFHGDSSSGPAPGGPEKRAALPEWADPNATPPALARVLESVVETYVANVKDKDLADVPGELLALAAKEKHVQKAHLMRQLAIHSMIAVDEPGKVAAMLDGSKVDDVRHTAVIGLRHWIGAREGRDHKLFLLLQRELHFGRAEAEATLQLLYSPYDRDRAETYQTLIAYLRHPRQAIRELAHWHLVRLAPAGMEIDYDASAPAAGRNKGADAWKKLVPDGELPAEKKDGTKTEGAK